MIGSNRLPIVALGLLSVMLAACPGPTPPVDTKTGPEKAGPVETEPTPDPTPPVPEKVTWPHAEPGVLVPGSGSGNTEPTIWAPSMRFPMKAGPAYANSQVWGVGGFKGPPGGQCAAANYSYPWHDNFCETRGWDNGFCPSSKGHQGQDIRAATCADSVHEVVAAESGIVTSIGSYAVFIKGTSGRIYRYLHMDMPHVRTILARDQAVTRGQVIGKVSDDFGGSATTRHLHFEIKAPVTRNGATAFEFVPTYTSLEDSYDRLLNSGA